jgi:N-formylglutamate amidohydrolase
MRDNGGTWDKVVIERRQLESKHEVFKKAELIKSHGVAEHGYLFEDGRKPHFN